MHICQVVNSTFREDYIVHLVCNVGYARDKWVGVAFIPCSGGGAYLIKGSNGREALNLFWAVKRGFMFREVPGRAILKFIIEDKTPGKGGNLKVTESKFGM